MITGLASIFASLGVALLLRLAAKDHHETVGGVEVFAYPTLYSNVILAAVPLIAVVYALMMITSRPGVDSPFVLNLLGGILFVLAVGAAWLYVFLRKFRVTITSEAIDIVAPARNERFLFRNFSKVEHFLKEKGQSVLTFWTQDQRPVLKLSSGLQDFDQLVDLISQRAKECGAEFVTR